MQVFALFMFALRVAKLCVEDDAMFGINTNHEKERYYLLPGMGGRAYRRKQKAILSASVAVGLVVSLVFAVIMYLICRPPQ